MSKKESQCHTECQISYVTGGKLFCFLNYFVLCFQLIMFLTFFQKVSKSFLSIFPISTLDLL